MPHYRTDLLESGEPIDVIEYQAQHPGKVLPPDPRILEGLLQRDLWDRGEALLVLAGFPTDNEVGSVGSVPCVLGNIGVGCGYLDGTSDKVLQLKGVTHPLKDKLQGSYRALRGYSKGQPLDETKAPQEWLAWAESKGFVPYWMNHGKEFSAIEWATGRGKNRVANEGDGNETDWASNARKIGERILKENADLKRLSVMQIAKKVRDKMERLHENGEPGMTNRSGRIPSAESIKRHALSGVKK